MPMWAFRKALHSPQSYTYSTMKVSLELAGSRGIQTAGWIDDVYFFTRGPNRRRFACYARINVQHGATSVQGEERSWQKSNRLDRTRGVIHYEMDESGRSASCRTAPPGTPRALIRPLSLTGTQNTPTAAYQGFRRGG